ncbi:MAG: TonB-dependent receptor [Cyclobacteriaceae bacterium]
MKSTEKETICRKSLKELKPLCLQLFLCIFFMSTMNTALYAQSTGIVSGVVTDGESGEPGIGVNVMVKGTLLGSFTRSDGTYIITGVPPGDQTLVFTSVGFEPYEKPISLIAGQELEEDVRLNVFTTVLGEVLVSGLRKSQINSNNSKREALNTREVLTTDDLGRLPDINVAEATQRVAGVSIETNKGEGQFVSIRGIQPSLNNVTLNNTTLASTTSNRSTALDLMPTEMISSIEVIKTNTPDMEGNAIGGTVNINTVSAFSKAKPFLIASVDGLYQQQQADLSSFDNTRLPFRVALTTGKRFGKKEQFGAVVSANFFRRDYSVSVLDPDGWEYYNNYFYPNEIELQIEDNERDRLGFTADLEFRPTEKNSIYLRGLHTRTREVALNSEFELTMQIGSARPLDQTRYTGRFDRGSGELDLSKSDEKEELYSFTMGTKNRFGKLSTDVYGTYARGVTNSYSPGSTFENPRDTEPELSLRYNTEPFFFEILPENEAFASDPANYTLRNVNFGRGDILEEIVELSADLKYDFKLGEYPSYLKFGGRYRDRSKVVDRSGDEYAIDVDNVGESENPYTLQNFNIPTFEPVQGGAAPFVHGDVNKFVSFIENRDENLSDPSRIMFDELETQYSQYENDLNNNETVSAGYVMGVFHLNKITAIAGLRLESTSTESNNAILTENEDEADLAKKLIIGNAKATNHYFNFLPSVNLKATLTNNLIGRLSWTTTIGRPDYAQLSGTTQSAFEETSSPGIFEGSLELANPDLKPYVSRNLDASLEYYLSKGGMIAFGGFHKRIENQIYNIENVFRDTLHEGRMYEELEVSQTANADAANLYGMEFTYDQSFTFLPPPFNGLGLTANFALIDSKVSLPNRPDEDLPLFRQASNVYNLVLYYQKRGLELRFATSHRSAYLTQAASIFSYEDEIAAGVNVSEFDRYTSPRTTYDITASYTFLKKKMRILGQVRNLTNEPEQGYQGNESRYDRHDLTGRSFFLGLSLNL